MSSDGTRDDSIKVLCHLLAGASSGAVTKTSIAPLERVKILLQIQGMHPNLTPKYHGIFQTAHTVVKEEGFLALYKGNGANVMRIIPTYALKFAFNDTFKDLVRAGQPGNKKLTFKQLIMSGTLAGLFQISMTYPLELVRTRLTLSEGMKQGSTYKGILDCGRQTVKVEGWKSLYKGITPTWLSGAPYVGLQMTFYEVIKNNIGDSHFHVLVSGSLSGIIAQTITYPGDTIRRRMQTNGIGGSPSIYSGMLDCISKTVRTEGFRALYKGLKANTVRCIPGAAIQFWAYDQFKSLLAG